MKLPSRILLAAATLVAASSASAANQTWTDAGPSDIWDASALNWGGAAWVNTGANDATFGNATTAAGESITLGQSITANGLTVNNNNATGYTFNIGAGLALNVNGNVTIGLNTNNSTTKATFTGAGSFLVGDGLANRTFQVGGATSGSLTADPDNAATLDMRNLSVFNANLGTGGTFRVGDISGAGDNSNTSSSAILAKTSTITAGTISVGGDTQHALAGAIQTLTLGDTENTLNANTISVGITGSNGRSSGLINFNPATTGTLKIRAADGVGRANMNLVNNSQTTSASMTGTVDLTGHSSDLLLGTLTIAVRTGATVAAGCTGTFSFDTGTLDVNSVVMATKTGTGTTATSTATLNIGGGTATINNGITMANATGTQFANATINLTGGVTTLGGNITKTSANTVAGATATINLNGGTLDMGSFAIGSTTNTVTLNTQAGVLRNLGQINGGGGLNKTSSGTLTLSGVNTYTGGTTITAGTLVTGSTGALSSGAVNVSGGTLQVGNGAVNTVTGVGAITLTSGALKFCSSDASITQAGANGFTLTNGFTLDLNSAFNAVGTYQLITSAGTSNNIGTFVLSGANTTDYAFNFALSGNNALLTVTAVPEPSTYGLIGAGALAAVAMVRRRRKLAGKVA